MKRFAFAPALALLLCGALSVPLLPSPMLSADQATAAAPTTQAPAAKAKYYRPVKGLARIEIIETPAKAVGKDVVTVLKVKNMSTGRIDLLQIDQYWYDKSLKEVTGTTEKYRKPFNPGDVIEITLKSPIKPNLYRHQLMFTHINGKVDVKKVDKFK
jgi:hypothetical protein